MAGTATDERRLESHEKTEKEIMAEKAAALGRIARTLEGHIACMHRIRREIPKLHGVERLSRVEKYAGVRQEAETYLWYLSVQREANGFRDPDTSRLEKAYPIPGPLKSSP